MGRFTGAERSSRSRTSQEIGTSPSVMKNPFTDLLESLQEVQSASQNASKENNGVVERRIPCPGSELKYFNNRNAAIK